MEVWELISPLVDEFGIEEVKLNMTDTGAPVDLTASASLLEGEEVNIEEGLIPRDPRSETDRRLGLVEDILISEREYCHTLRSVCDLYEKPLRKLLSLDNKDYRALFDWVEPVCSLSNLVIKKLENALEFWDSKHTKIGNIFSKQLWNKYEEYQCIFRSTTLPLLREKEQNDEDFVALCQLRQGAAKYSLDGLLHLPLDRLVQYEQYLSQLAEETSEDHPDNSDICRASLKATKMVKRTEAAKEETDLDRIQDLFPNDNLRLHDRDPFSPKKNLSRTKSAAAYKLQKALPGKSKMFPNENYRSPQKKDIISPQRRLSRQECSRSFIMEGSVQFTMGVQSQDRHLFLFNDLLVVAKPRSGGTFRLKEKVLVCELWTSTCINEVSEISLSHETSFVLGWPTINVAVTFNSNHTKQLWEDKLKQLISTSKEKEGKSVTSIQFSLCSQNSRENIGNHYITLKVNNRQTAKDCIKLLLEQLSQNGINEYQLWIKSRKEDAPYPLIGHEFPFSIKMSFIRTLLQRSELDLHNFSNISTDTKCTFILRKKSQKATSYPNSQALKKQKKQRRTTLISWPFKRNNGKQDSVDSGNSSPPPGNLFGQDLNKLCLNGIIPNPIMAILTQLFQKGPFTVGIFRKSANARCCRELKQKLEVDPDYDLRDVSVLVLASVLKEFLRNLPDCLLLSTLYNQWLDAIGMESKWKCREHVLNLVQQLPMANFNLLQHLLCVLWHIAQHASENKMSAANLAVCIGPSLLSPLLSPVHNSSSIHQQEITKKVPKLVTYLIENCSDIFGQDCLHLFGEMPERDHSRQDSGAEESDSFHSLQDIGGNYRRDDSSIDSLERDYLDDGDHSPKLPSEAKMSLTNLSRDSGLTLSDTQLYTPEEELENDLSPSSDVLRIKGTISSFAKSTPHLEMTGIDNGCGNIYTRSSGGVSIDGSCHDVVRKRKGMEYRPKNGVGSPYSAVKFRNHCNDINTHSSLIPSHSYCYGVENEKFHYNHQELNNSGSNNVKHRKMRGRALCRQPVISDIDAPKLMPPLRRSASEESLHQISIPQETSRQHVMHRKRRAPSPPSCQRVSALSSSAPDCLHRDRHAVWFANQNRCVDWKRSQSTSKIDEIDFSHNNSSLSIVSNGSSTPHVSRSNSRVQELGAQSHGDIYGLYQTPNRVSSVCSSSSETSQRSHHSHISYGSNRSKRSCTSQNSSCSQGSSSRITPGLSDNGKPIEPPSYQETINRQTLLRGMQNSNALSTEEIRDDQTVMSSKARQLYENSVRMYSQTSNTTVETHHAVPVTVLNNDERVSIVPPVPPKPHVPLHSSNSDSPVHRLRHHPPVHVSDSQIVRQSNYQGPKVMNMLAYRQGDRDHLPEDWRKEINWSVAQLRTLFTPDQHSQLSSSIANSRQHSPLYPLSPRDKRTGRNANNSLPKGDSCHRNESLITGEESFV
ncbi:uncharacterized protein [Centruroides vittatus]